MRRDPPFGKLIPAYDPSVTGFKNLIPAASGTVIDLQSVVIASNGAAGTATFSTNGTPFKTLAVPANGSADCEIGSYELPIGSGLDVTTTTSMAVTAWYGLVDETTPIIKEQARANTYSAWKSQKALGQNAIRTPNRFGNQVEG